MVIVGATKQKCRNVVAVIVGSSPLLLLLLFCERPIYHLPRLVLAKKIGAHGRSWCAHAEIILYFTRHKKLVAGTGTHRAYYHTSGA